MTRLGLIAVALMFGVVANAGAQGGKQPPKSLDREQISASLRSAEAALTSEDYSELSSAKRNEVQMALGRIKATLDEYPDQAAIPENRKVALFNDQEMVNTVLMRAKEDSRMICKRERVVGSNRLTSRCMTVAERRRLREEAQDSLTRSPQQQLDLGI